MQISISRDGPLLSKINHLYPALEQYIDDSTRLLAAAMGLPLVDGVFATLVVTGVLDTISGIVSTGLVIFGGSLMLSVIISEMAGESPRQRLRRVLLVGALIVPATGLEAIIAPTLRHVLSLGRFQLFGALVIMIIAFKIANDELGRLFPAPRYVVLVGLLLSLSPGGAELVLLVKPLLVAQAVGAASLAVTVAAGAALVGPVIDDLLDLERFRLGSGIALALIPFGLYGLVATSASLAVLAIATVFAYDGPIPSFKSSPSSHTEVN